MSKRVCAILLAAAAMAAFAVPALAEPVQCTVKSEIRVRQKPSKKAHVVSVLKKDAKVTTAEKCAGGWVKISTENGKISGYVGGWALAAASPAADEAAKPATAATTEPVAEKKDVPTNEQLAIQITDLKVRVVGMERNMKKMNRDIQKIKTSMAREAKEAKAAKAPAK